MQKLQSIKQSLRHPVTWDARDRDPAILGLRMPVPIHILCACQMFYAVIALLFLAFALVFTEDPVWIGLNIGLVFFQLLVYGGCIFGAEKKHFLILAISTVFVILITLGKIGANLAYALGEENKTDIELIREFRERDREKGRRERIYGKELVDLHRSLVWAMFSITTCCLLCFNGAIVGLCAFYAKHIKKGKLLNPLLSCLENLSTETFVLFVLTYCMYKSLAPTKVYYIPRYTRTHVRVLQFKLPSLLTF